jgi:hypothetical protein
MPIFIELNQWAHSWIDLLANGGRYWRWTGIEQVPCLCVGEQLHCPLERAAQIDRRTPNLLRMLQSSCGRVWYAEVHAVLKG